MNDQTTPKTPFEFQQKQAKQNQNMFAAIKLLQKSLFPDGALDKAAPANCNTDGGRDDISDISDHSQTEPAQAFVHIIDDEVKEMQGNNNHNQDSMSSSKLPLNIGSDFSQFHEFEQTSTETKAEIEESSPSKILDHVEEGSSYNITHLLTERLNLIESIHLLGRHSPQCVMNDLQHEVLRISKHQTSQMHIPHAKIYEAALLFIDMSGFTKLSQLLDLESLSKVNTAPHFCTR